MRTAILIASLALTACGPREAPILQGDPTATAALLAQPDAQFIASSQIARQISDRCATIGFNQGFNDAVTVQRFGAADVARSLAGNRNATDLEKDVGIRSLQARYNIDFNQADLCAVGEGELARKSALSAVLVSI